MSTNEMIAVITHLCMRGPTLLSKEADRQKKEEEAEQRRADEQAERRKQQEQEVSAAHRRSADKGCEMGLALRQAQAAKAAKEAKEAQEAKALCRL